MGGITSGDDYEDDVVVWTWDYGIGAWTHEGWRLWDTEQGWVLQCGCCGRMYRLGRCRRRTTAARRAGRRIAAARRLTKAAQRMSSL